MLKPMLPTLAFEPPIQGEWLYEMKYDGFRGILEWTSKGCFLWSRNGKDLLPQFPEIKDFLLKQQETVSELLPIVLDGELVILQNDWKANFQQLQKGGGCGHTKKSLCAAAERPCTYLVFDILMHQGNNKLSLPYIKRKELLLSLFDRLNFSLIPSLQSSQIIQYIPYFKDFDEISGKMKECDSEGIIAKLATSTWDEGKRTLTWVKLKNWKTVSCFLTAFDDQNGFFHVGVFQKEKIIPLGLFINGIDSETKASLREVIKHNFKKNHDHLIPIEPGICLDLNYLEWTAEQLREPYFKALRFDLLPEHCTYENFLIENADFPNEVQITHPEKILYEKNSISKLDFLRYLRAISPLILPFLKNRPLTLIRAPHGEFGEAFYQKSRPETAPSFVQSFHYGDVDMIVCNDLKTLTWLGNQLAIEYHIPFHTTKSSFVSEIVFDLDPPSRDEFHLAIKAAKIIKDIFDQLKLTGFVKLSGNKGMQVYVPLPDGVYTWEDTRVFTEFVATFLITSNPDSFTIERLKKNRGGRLYVDFIQHAEGKTIIAPYSVRNNEDALVAAPVFWHEVTDQLKPGNFTIHAVLNRINHLGDPFSLFFFSKKNQPFDQVLKMIKKDY